MSRVQKLRLCPRVSTLQIQFRKNRHTSIDPSYEGLLWFWLAYHGPLGKQLSFHLELLCTIECGTLTAKMAPILHPFVIPCPLQVVLKLFPSPWICAALVICFSQEHTQKISTCQFQAYAPTGCERLPLLSQTLPPLANNRGLVWGRMRPHGAKPRLPQTSSPRHLASWPPALSAPPWAQPSSTRIITATSRPADAWANEMSINTCHWGL